MSGVEFIIGTTLASIPLTLEAYDRIGRTVEIVKTIQHFPQELSFLLVTVNVQRVIFRNNSIRLLTAITQDRSAVDRILRDPASLDAQAGLTIGSCFALQLEALRDSFTTCQDLIVHMQRALHELRVHFEGLGTNTNEPSQNPPSTQPYQFKKRLTIALHKPRIKIAIAELRRLNADYHDLTGQIETLLRGLIQGSTYLRPDQRPRILRRLDTLERYFRIRVASQALYSTLELKWACALYRRHTFDIRVVENARVDFKDDAQESNLPQSYVTCELTISHGDILSTTTQAPFLLQVEQVIAGPEKSLGNEDRQHSPATSSIQDLVQTLQNHSQSSGVIPNDASRPILRKRDFIKNFHPVNLVKSYRSRHQQQIPLVILPSSSTSLGGPSLTVQVSTPSTLVIEDSDSRASSRPGRIPNMSQSVVLDLALVDDFCQHAQQLRTSSCEGRPLLGSWHDPKARWFVVAQPPGVTCQSIGQIIRWVAEDDIDRSFPCSDRIKFAGDVADGVMSFCSTPWLADTDLSQQVRYLCKPLSVTVADTGSSSDIPTLSPAELEGPFFMTCTRNKGVRRADDGSTAHSSGAPNELLFHFGVLLLEIGLEKPWSQLKQGRNMASTLSDYDLAKGLTSQLVQQMGPRYAKLTRKCLTSDFGPNNTDLEDERLQGGFIEDVLLVLRQLEERIRQVEGAS